MPPAEQVRDALARILASDVFARSERARDLLRYLIEQDLAGHADRLKGFSIAVDVFGKDAAFDPSQDTVVRVQAGRLRELLEHYYAGPGSSDPLRVLIPRGSYVPDYVVPEIAEVEGVDADEVLAADEPPALHVVAATVAPLPSGGRSMVRSVVSVAAVVVALALGGYWLAQPGEDESGTAIAEGMTSPTVGYTESTGSVPQDFLPSVYLSQMANEPVNEIVTAAMRRGLASFDSVHLISRQPVEASGAESRRTEYLFDLSSGLADGEVNVELQHLASGKVLVARSIQTAGRERHQIEDEIADLLTSVATVSGSIYANLSEIRSHTALTQCLDLNERFYRNQDAEAHRAAYGCLEDLAAADINSSLIYSELASLHVQAIVSRYAYPQDPSPQQALHYARNAIQLSPNSSYAHRSMGYVVSRTGTQEEGLRWTRRAHELNTFDLGMAASYGYALIFNGEYAEGTPILRRAVGAASAHPTWWDYGLFLGNFMLDDMRAAANAVTALGSSRRAHYLAVQLVAADALGRRDEAGRLLGELLADHANFAANPMAFFRRGSYPEDLAVKLVQALARAGLGTEG